MFTISPEAFAALQSDADRRFVAKLAGVLRDAVPSLADEPEGPFLAQVTLLVEQARSYDLVSEQAIGSYGVTAGLLGVDFPDHFPGARQILEGPEPEDRKAELLEAFTLAILDTLAGR